MRKLVCAGTLVALVPMLCLGQTNKDNQKQPLADAVQEAQTPRRVEIKRPEQRKTEKDDPKRFAETNAMPISPVFKQQPEEGKIKGFDFYIDPLNAKKPRENPDDILKADEAAKPGVMEAQRKLLESRYNLTPKLDPEVKMSRGKPIAVGPTAKLKKGASWDSLAKMTPQEIKEKDLFPYPSLPHPKHVCTDRRHGLHMFGDMGYTMF